MVLIATALLFVTAGVALALVPRMRGFVYFATGLVLSLTAFLLFFWRDLPFGSTLASPEGPLAVAAYHLLPFLMLFYLPLHVGYFVTRLIQRRRSDRARII